MSERCEVTITSGFFDKTLSVIGGAALFFALCVMTMCAFGFEIETAPQRKRLDRQAAALERIADALDRAHPKEAK